MSKKLFSRVVGFFSSRTFVGTDKFGNRYFNRKEEIDGVLKEKRWVEFRGEEDPTSLPVEWICWLNGQRKKAPTPEEGLSACWAVGQGPKLDCAWKFPSGHKANVPKVRPCGQSREIIELEARRERARLNAALLKKEEEERKAKQGAQQRRVKTGKVEGPDLKSFIQQLKGISHDDRGGGLEKVSDVMHGTADSRSSKSETRDEESSVSLDADQQPVSSEPTGSGSSFKPGTWQPPT